MTNHAPHPFFSNQWQSPQRLSLSALERVWLEHTGSMTAKLGQLGRLEVMPLQESSTGLAADEANFLGSPLDSDCHLREVVLSVDATACIYARSLMPLSSLAGANQQLSQLATTPLGAALFRAPEAERRYLEACRLPASQLPIEVESQQQLLLARRSLFIKNGQPLLVAECFLPNLWQLAASGASNPNR